MCGRYTHLLTWQQIVELYGLLFDGETPVAPNDFGLRYNIAPTQKAPVVRQRDGKRECGETPAPDCGARNRFFEYQTPHYA